MQGEDNRQSWVLIAVASLSALLGAIALVVAFQAKSSSDDAADQASVATVSAKLTRLTDRLGVEEQNLSGKETRLREAADEARQEGRDAASGLGERLAQMERRTKNLESSNTEAVVLRERIATLEQRSQRLESQNQTINQRITQLKSRMTANSAGGEAAP